MDKASIIKDAIEYIQHLQAGERHMEVEVSVLESAAGAKDNYGDGLSVEQVSSAQRKKVKRAVSITSMNDALLAAAVVVTSLPVEVLELRVPEVSEKLLVVSMTCSKKRGAMTKVCSALEELCPMVIIANITSISDCSMHTLFVKTTAKTAQNSETKAM
ncbi:transcription factor BHLH6 [Aegilops tauschii subsp. strangulata]|uniref:transcription factor BHLH6 n=1 Tax=Aegilops tauschii subsp. strangulata TaxID=200361 RepID=UPI003CC8D3CB